MFKNLINKYGVVNGDVSDAEVFDVLKERFPHVRFVNGSTSKLFKIVARSGIAKLTVGRNKKGVFQFQSEVSGIYQVLTLGLMGLFDGWAGRKQFLEISDFIRERFHQEGAL